MSESASSPKGRASPLLLLRALAGFRRDKWPLCLALISGFVAAFMGLNHAYVPMWTEGMPGYQHQILAAFGYLSPTDSCWGITIGGCTLPLGHDAYIGAANTYLDMLGAYPYLVGITSDAYSYRYVTIPVLLIATWLFYLILRRYYPPRLAFLGSSIYLVSPVQILFNLTDHRIMLTNSLFVLGAALAAITYIQDRRPRRLWLASFLAGLCLWTRVEALAWPLISVLLYCFVFTRAPILEWWRTVGRRGVTLGYAALAFLAGALPFLLYNLTCPRNNFLSFVWGRSMPNLLGTSGIAGKMEQRLEQFIEFDLLNIVPIYDMWTPNTVFACVFLFSVAIVIWRWATKGEVNYPLFAIAAVLPMSLFVSTILRHEHLHMLLPATVAIVVSGCAKLSQVAPWGRYAASTMLLGVLANGGVATALDWAEWRNQPSHTQNMLNQSGSEELTSALLERHREDEILFTNIGMRQYVQFASRGELSGRDIMNWFSPAKFRLAVLDVLKRGDRRRVFVTIPPAREGLPNLVRTRYLLDVLDAYSIPHTTVRLASRRNAFLYDLVVVEKGVVAAGFGPPRPIFIEMVNSFLLNESVVRGRIRGGGFRAGDQVVVNSTDDAAVVGSSGDFIYFDAPTSAVGSSSTFSVEVRRDDGLARSQPFEAFRPLQDGSPFRMHLGPGHTGGREMLRIRRLRPAQTTAGQKFLVQPGGQAAIWVDCEGATRDTVVVWEDQVLPTTFGTDEGLSALIPDGFYDRPGPRIVYLWDWTTRERSNSAGFEVLPQ